MNDVFVRDSGLVDQLSRFAKRRAVTCGVISIPIALGASFLTGAFITRGIKH